MYNIPDHPVVRSMERTGFPRHEDDIIGYCEVCGRPIYDGDVFDERGWLGSRIFCEEHMDVEEDYE